MAGLHLSIRAGSKPIAQSPPLDALVLDAELTRSEPFLRVQLYGMRVEGLRKCIAVGYEARIFLLLRFEVTPFSFRRLISSYRASPRFTKLSAISKRDYHKRLEKIGDWLGDKDASRYPRPEVIRMRDAHSDKAREANYLVSVMSVLMEHAIDLGWRNENPAKGVSKF